MKAAVGMLGAGLLAAAWPSPGAAMTILGVGAKSCATWTAARRTTSWFEAAGWIAGYLSRAAFADGRDLLRAPEAADLHAWIDGYCADHPDDSLQQAADALELELIGRTEAPAAPAPPRAP